TLLAGAQAHVEHAIDGRGVNADADLAFARLRVRHGLVAEHVRRPIAVNDDRFHAEPVRGLREVCEAGGAKRIGASGGQGDRSTRGSWALATAGRNTRCSMPILPSWFSRTREKEPQSMDLNDKYACAELIQAWGLYRDQGKWPQLLETFVPEGQIAVSWFSGRFPEFVDRCRQGC